MVSKPYKDLVQITTFVCPQAIKYHKQELTISKEVNDRASEASTHGNLAVAYQALNMHDMALTHYHSHLNIARELKDNAGKNDLSVYFHSSPSLGSSGN